MKKTKTNPKGAGRPPNYDKTMKQKCIRIHPKLEKLVLRDKDFVSFSEGVNEIIMQYYEVDYNV